MKAYRECNKGEQKRAIVINRLFSRALGLRVEHGYHRIRLGLRIKHVVFVPSNIEAPSG